MKRVQNTLLLIIKGCGQWGRNQGRKDGSEIRLTAAIHTGLDRTQKEWVQYSVQEIKEDDNEWSHECKNEGCIPTRKEC